MLAAAKVLVLALAVTGAGTASVATGMVVVPLTKAIEIHEDNLGTDSPLPDQAMKGQQIAYDHIMKNQERWLAKHPDLVQGGSDDDGNDEEEEEPVEED